MVWLIVAAYLLVVGIGLLVMVAWYWLKRIYLTMDRIRCLLTPTSGVVNHHPLAPVTSMNRGYRKHGA